MNITHGSGDPGYDFDVWYATQQNAGQDMQRGTLGVKKTFLDLDGDGWTTNDLRIGNDTNQIVAGGVGYMDAVNIFTDSISRIVVILPERAVAVASTHGWFGTNTIGNPTGAGVYPYGSSVTVSVDRLVLDPENPGRRLRVTGVTVE